MHDIAAHLRQHRLQGGEQFRGGADHEGQRPCASTAGAAGDWSISYHHTLLGRRSGNLADGLRVDGAAIHGRYAFTNSGEHTVFIQPHAVHMGSGGQHGYHQLRALCRFTR